MLRLRFGLAFFYRTVSIACAITLLASPTSASKQEAEATALIGRVKQLSDIRAEGAPPFRLKMDFKIIKNDGGVTEGTYTELWVSRTQWRRETTLGDFRRIQVAAGRTIWTDDNSVALPQWITDIPLLSNVSRFRPEAWRSRKDREINGVAVRCLENHFDHLGENWALCFDKISGTLTAEISPSQSGSASGERVCLHSAYQKFGEYTVAMSYECDEKERPTLRAKILDLAPYAPRDSALFIPSEGAKGSTNCLGLVKPPSVIRRQDPPPPKSFSGTNVVTMTLVVGTDGKPHDLRVTSPPNRDYDEAALGAVQDWRYRPATCDGEPMEVPVAVQTEFHHF